MRGMLVTSCLLITAGPVGPAFAAAPGVRARLALQVAPATSPAVTLLQGPANEPYTASDSIQADSIAVATSPLWGIPVVASSPVPWLTFRQDCSAPGQGSSIAGGVTPFTLAFCVDPSKVTANGYYIGLIEVTAQGHTTLRVSIRLTKFPTGNLAASPDSVELSAARPAETVAVTADPAGQNNQLGGFTTALDFTSSLGKPDPPEGPWLTVSQSGARTPGSVVLTADPQRLKDAGPGTYTNTVVLKDTKYNDIKTVKVNLTVQGQDVRSVSALPHIAVGDRWVTGFHLLNSSAQPASATLQFYDDSGQPLAIPISGSAASASLTENLAPYGSTYLEAGTPQFPLRVGWALVTASPSVTAQALFRADVGGGRYFEASVPASSGGRGFLLPFNAMTFAPAGVPLYTGIAVVNLDPNAQATITCVARDPQGNTIPNAVALPALAALGHYSEYNFTALAGRRGTLECTSNTSIAALALRSIGTGNAFSSLPVVTLK